MKKSNIIIDTMHTISKEQSDIVESLENNNVIVDAVAGSGKTTTCLYIAKKFINIQILLLTYNAKLKFETRDRTARNNINNLEVHSYHSFCVKYYHSIGYRDNGLSQIVNNNLPLNENINYGMIILDESQDMNPLYHSIACKIYRDNQLGQTSSTRICILGDKFQSIYDFNNADQRFLVYANELFKFNDIPWVNYNLSKSFRLTKQTSDFINHCMLKSERIKSSKMGSKPTYVICNVFRKKPLQLVQHYLKSYKPEDIFILAPSVKSLGTPVRRLENSIKKYIKNVPIYVPSTDDEKVDSSIIEKKLVISTYHQTKGLERKVVIVFNFDHSYFQFYKKNKDVNICPNELYVCTTRALEHLVLIHHYENKFLEFLDQSKLLKYTTFQREGKTNISDKTDNLSLSSILTSPTDLCNHLSFEVMTKAITYFKIINIRPVGKRIFIPTKYDNETVSDINGVVIPLLYEYYLKGSIDIINEIPEDENITMYSQSKKKRKSKTKSTSKYDINVIKKNLVNGKPKMDEILYLANRWLAFKSGYLFKIKQITDYNWFNESIIKQTYENMQSLNISKTCVFECKAIVDNKEELLNRKLIGYIDCVDTVCSGINKQYNIYEFKCVHLLEDKHYLQLAIYAYMYESILLLDNDNSLRNYYIYNILSDELNEITFNMNDLKEMMQFIIYNKYTSKKEINDEEFIKNMKNNSTSEKIINFSDESKQVESGCTPDDLTLARGELD